ncbi:uncharacterized protein PV07_10646 [Cladophialophora immunda]|uniref:Uncharacterized protein n=1 Tax=Cladophialophora immunda TaxID=569365 RepID=A0A0D2C3G1_9EURO|nr:uncharacterized protein PV07_10646 [Cladophialophora immunda]KIW24970.1 hypothetical protein PV07_10646 [Cladophialophora immunda]
MGRGRPPYPRSEDERVAIRREKVRLNVQAHRERQKLKKRLEALNAPYQPRLRWVQETKWQSKRATDTRDQNQVVKYAPTRCGRSPGSHCSLLNHPGPEKQYTLALLALFRSRLLPDRVTLRRPGPSEQRLTTPCAPWVVRGYELAAVKENPLMIGMLRALGLALLGADHQREDIQMVAQRTYQTTLPAVSRQLGLLMNGCNRSSSDYPTLMLSCHAAAMFELNVGGSLLDLNRHVRGLGCLLVHRFLESKSMPDDVYDLLEEYRLFELVFCFISRQKSVLTGTPLATEAISTDGRDLGNQHMSQISRLVRCAGSVPPIMVYVDRLKSGTLTGERELARMSKFLKTLSCTTTGLQIWCEDFLANDARSVAESSNYTSGHGDLAFPNLEVLTAWTYYLSFKMHTLETCISLLEHATLTQSSLREVEYVEDSTKCIQSSETDEEVILLRSDLLETTKLLLRSLPYFSETSLGYIGRSLVAFPLETAKRTLLHEFERRSSLTLAGSEAACVDSSDHTVQDIIEGIAALKLMATSAKASGCALFSD